MTRAQSRLQLNGRLVLELDRGRVRELILAVALAGIMLLPLLLYVWQSSEWIRTGYRIEQLKNQRDHLAEINLQLRLEKASLESLARIQQLAGEQLGLAEPPGGTVVLVDTSRLRPASQHVSGRVASTRTSLGRSEPDASGSHPAN